jgi:hypothetical protein
LTVVEYRLFVVADVIDLVFKFWFDVSKCVVENGGLVLFVGDKESDVGVEAVVIHFDWLRGHDHFLPAEQSVLRFWDRDFLLTNFSNRQNGYWFHKRMDYIE